MNHVALVLTGGPPKSIAKIMVTRRSRSLVDLGGKTLLNYIVSSIKELVDEVTVVYDDDNVVKALMDCDNCSSFRVEERGIRETICRAISRLEAENIITVIYGDIYADKEFYSMHIRRISIDPKVVLVSVTRPSIYKKGFTLVRQDDEGYVRAIGSGDLVVAGILSAKNSLLKQVLCKESKDMISFLQKMVSKERLRSIMWLGTWVDIDTPWDYLVAVQNELSKQRGLYIHEEAKVSDKAYIEPPVYVAKGVYVDANAVIKGPAYIGPDSLIGAHSFVRSGVLVQQNAVIGAYSEVKRSVVCRNARIGSHSYITDSIIGEEAELAPYTITQNIPYYDIPNEARILLSTSLPLEKIKIGAVFAARSKTKPHTVLKPGHEYA